MVLHLIVVVLGLMGHLAALNVPFSLTSVFVALYGNSVSLFIVHINWVGLFSFSLSYIYVFCILDMTKGLVTPLTLFLIALFRNLSTVLILNKL